jgi:hypothetical protein
MWRYGKSLLQTAFAITAVFAALWICLKTEQDFRALDSGALSSLKVDRLTAMAYNTFGSYGAIIAWRVIATLAILGSLVGIKGAIDGLKSSSSLSTEEQQLLAETKDDWELTKTSWRTTHPALKGAAVLICSLPIIFLVVLFILGYF